MMKERSAKLKMAMVYGGKGSVIIWYRSGVSEFMGKFWYETVSVWKVVFFVY